MTFEHIAKTVEDLPDERALAAVLFAHPGARACLTSRFQAEELVVAHLLRKPIPVLFLETGYHFPDTHAYRERVAGAWSLNVVNVLPQQTVPEQESALGLRYVSDPARCCQLKKVARLMRALEPFDVWFTGLRREQSPTREI